MRKKTSEVPKIIKKNRLFLPTLETILLILFLAVIILGLSQFDSIRRYNYLANYTVWFIWWPLLMVIGLFSIRLWCMVCPLRFITKIYGKYSFGLKIPAKLEKYRTVFMAVLFMTVHSTVVYLNIDKLPITTALYLLILLQYSAVLAIIFERNSFCRVFCPLGGVLSVFSRLSFLKLNTKNKQNCSQCPGAPCSRNCPVALSPQRLPDNTCILCMACIQNCEKENYVLEWSNPYQEKANVLDLGGYLSIAVLLGIALSEFSERLKEMGGKGEWNLLLEKIIEFIPNKLNQWVGINHSKLFIIAWEYLIFPSLLIIVLTMLARIIFFHKDFKYHLHNLALSIIPFIFCVFLAVLVNYPLTLLLAGAGFFRKGVLLLILILGAAASLYTFFYHLFTKVPNVSVQQSYKM